MPLGWAADAAESDGPAPVGGEQALHVVPEGRHHCYVIEVDQVGCLLGVADPFEQRRVRREPDDVGPALQADGVRRLAQSTAESVTSPPNSPRYPAGLAAAGNQARFVPWICALVL